LAAENGTQLVVQLQLTSLKQDCTAVDMPTGPEVNDTSPTGIKKVFFKTACTMINPTVILARHLH
jgi:hypothetical protein